MSNNTLKKSEEKPTNLNYYWLITFFLFFMINIAFITEKKEKK